MSELLRYEEVMKQQLADLPLPDENFAWQEMRKLLDEDDDDPVIVPPLKWGCGPGAILVAVLLIGIAWWFIRPEKWFNSAKTKEVITHTIVEKEKNTAEDKRSNPENEDFKTDSLAESMKNKIVRNNSDKLSTPGSPVINDVRENAIVKKLDPGGSASQNAKGKLNNKHIARPVQDSQKNKINRKNLRQRKEDLSGHLSMQENQNPIIAKIDSVIGKQQVKEFLSPIKNSANVMKDSSVKKLPAKDSAINLKTDSIPSKDSVKTKKKEESTYSWSAGLAINQQIPFDGQTATTYSSLGREASVKDYIPSAYVRFNKDKKWFVQGELRYGAPQYAKGTVYDIKSNTATGFDTHLTVKKTYYHQLPAGFNYYVLPGLSIGAGVVWNRFSSAVSQEDVYAVTTGRPDSLLSTGIVRTRTRNKAFSKSFFQALGEMQYSYKQFTLGARYAKGIQPYLKFQLPGEPVKEERNSSLQLFFRYELWKSKKK